jgi:peptide deformylase
MIRDILRMGDPRLNRTAQPWPDDAMDAPELARLIGDLWQTMHAANGAGLAAPQIGENWQVVVFGTGKPIARYPDAPGIAPQVLINPVITPLRNASTGQIDEQFGFEGCLSVPGLRAEVPRWAHIRYEGFDEKGQRIVREARGFAARVVQHECDHLWGKLFPSRVRDFHRFGFTDVLPTMATTSPTPPRETPLQSLK